MPNSPLIMSYKTKLEAFKPIFRFRKHFDGASSPSGSKQRRSDDAGACRGAALIRAAVENFSRRLYHQFFPLDNPLVPTAPRWRVFWPSTILNRGQAWVRRVSPLICVRAGRLPSATQPTPPSCSLKTDARKRGVPK